VIGLLFKKIGVVDENYELQRDMYVLVKEDRIEYISKVIPVGFEGEVYDGKNKVLVPGFFNTHCHVPMTLLRGYGEGLPLHRWLTEKMFPFEAKLKPEDCYWGSLLGAAEMIKSGVVSFTEMYFDIEDIIRAVNESGLKGNISHGMSFNPRMPSLRDLKGCKDTERMLQIVNSSYSGRIKVDLGLHAEYTSTESLVREVAEYAVERNLIVHTHVSETRKEHEECKERTGYTPLGYFNKCGLMEQPVIAAHCVWVDESDIQLLKEKSVTPVHCISSNLKLGSGFAPVKRMIELGIPVALGTDGASSNNNLNMLEEITLAAMANKGITGDPMFMTPGQILRLGTVNGARAQGRLDCGSIMVGNKADLVVFDMDKPHLQPVFDEMANIVFSAQSEDICMTMIDGRVVYKDGEFKTIDIERVKFEAVSTKDRILSELA
jgi:5-methylthioadenosine/S-adenosylhomocysteine deaminase